MLKQCDDLKLNATEQYFPVFPVVLRVVLTFESMDKILHKCGHSNES